MGGVKKTTAKETRKASSGKTAPQKRTQEKKKATKKDATGKKVAAKKEKPLNAAQKKPNVTTKKALKTKAPLIKKGKKTQNRTGQKVRSLTKRAVNKTTKRPVKTAVRPSTQKAARPETLGRWKVQRTIDVDEKGNPVQKVSYHTKFTADDANKPTWDAFCTETTEELMKSNKKLPLHREGGQWGFRQSDGVLFFTDKNGEVYAKSTDVIIAGSYCNSTNTWMWGWNNPSIRPELTMPAKKKVETYVQKNIFCCLYPTYFGLQVVPCCGEGEGWRFSAVVNKILGGVAVYRGPHGPQSTFFVMKNLILS
jgi:hypothetical protein